MKRIFIMMLIANALAIFALSSCKKDNFSSDGNNNSSDSGVPSNSTVINLIAVYWVKDANGIYSCNFPGIISGVTPNHASKTYLVERGKETLISSSIFFMGGVLWATNTQTDVKINYHSYAQGLPFDYLIIKVVVE